MSFVGKHIEAVNTETERLDVYLLRAHRYHDCGFCPEDYSIKVENVHGPPKYLHASSTKEAEWYAFFHDDCSSCPASSDNADLSLCDFCKHLRLPHLLNCIRGSINIELNFGPLSRLESCEFCRLAAAASFRPGTSMKHVSVRLFAGQAWPWMGLSGDMGVRELRLPEFRPSKPTIYAHQSGNKITRASDETLPVHASEIAWAQIRETIKNCSIHHLGCQGNYGRSPPSDFRVIDTCRRCVVKAPKDCRYVALSYVWGTSLHGFWLQATLQSIETLGKEGSLRPSRIPATVNDALEVCRRLGEEYLWVDQLCIIQNDAENIQHQIDSMASIYSAARFVIVAANGDNMNSGISGLSIGRSPPCALIGGTLLTYVGEDELNELRSSPWAKRGWTYQEAILPKKKLCFTSSQVVYSCEETTFSDNLVARYTKRQYSPDRRDGTLGLKRGYSQVNDAYAHNLCDYRERFLGKGTDMLNAFSGILDALYGLENTFFGLPHGIFSQALLWYLKVGEAEGPQKSVNRSDGSRFPSWSWASTVGPMEPCTRVGLQTFLPLVRWFRCSVPGKVQAIDALMDGDYRGPLPNEAIAIAWNEGCFEPPCPLPHYATTDWKSLNKRGYTQWSCYRDFYQEAFGRGQPDLTNLQSYIHPGRLVARVQVGSFRLGPPPSQYRFDQFNLAILDDCGQAVGAIHGQDPLVQLEILPHLAFRDRQFEFIALSMGGVDFPMTDWDTQHGALCPFEDVSYLDAEIESTTFIPQVDVMLIGRNGPLAHRICIGAIYLKKWVAAKPKFETIVLE